MTRNIFEHQYVNFDYSDLETTQRNGSRHYITPNGKAYPSITTILGELSKKAILEWRKRVGDEEANKISRHAATRGTALHNIVERYLNNEEEYFSKNEMPHCKALFNSIKDILDNRVGRIACQEKAMYSHHLGVAGRVDCVADFDGKLSIIDFKTSKRRKTKDDIPNYFMQAAAYAIMFEERTRKPVSQLVIIMAVDDDPNPIVFVEKRDNHVRKLFEAINQYKQKYLYE